VWDYAGVRPLYDDKAEDASAVTRDYVLDIEEMSDGAPFMSVYGGKITTSRKLGEHAMDKLKDYYDYKAGNWTEDAQLPGGDLLEADFERFYGDMRARYSALNTELLHRLCRAYGTRITLILGDGSMQPELGQHFGAGLYELEAKYLINHEWATSAEDILWRRSKLGLHMSESQRAAFTDWFNSRNS
jgi:glycerol-3-phosphate dehydrogenase